MTQIPDQVVRLPHDPTDSNRGISGEDSPDRPHPGGDADPSDMTILEWASPWELLRRPAAASKRRPMPFSGPSGPAETGMVTIPRCLYGSRTPSPAPLVLRVFPSPYYVR